MYMEDEVVEEPTYARGSVLHVLRGILRLSQQGAYGRQHFWGPSGGLEL
jgi:hypothetical protein